MVLMGVFLTFIVTGAVMSYAYITSVPFFYFVGGLYLSVSLFALWKAYKKITK